MRVVLKNLFLLFGLMLAGISVFSILAAYFGSLIYLSYLGVELLMKSGFQQSSDIVLGLGITIVAGRIISRIAKKFSTNTK